MSDKSINNVGPSSSDPTSIKLDYLLPIIQRSHGGKLTGINNWTSTQLNSGIGGGAIYRFSGQGHINDETVNWSMILKILKPSAKGWDDTALSDWSYYKREADAYRSGWLSDLPNGIAAPCHLGITEFPDGTCWLWLEDIRDSLEKWSMQDYGHIARDIGRFNGAFLTGTSPLPQQPWVSSNWIRGYISMNIPAMEPLRNSLDNPLVRHWFPGNTSDEFFRLWNQRETYLNAMDRLPQTMCHLDLFRRNMFLVNNVLARKQTIAIDWAFAGIGCIGADISPLVIASLAFFEVGLDKVHELDQIVFDGYLEGLRQADWQGDPLQARLGYLIANLRYHFSETNGFLSAVFDENMRNTIEQAFGHPLSEVFDYIAATKNAVSYLDDERSKLMDKLI